MCLSVRLVSKARKGLPLFRERFIYIHFLSYRTRGVGKKDEDETG
jgi:hypothetical protein